MYGGERTKLRGRKLRWVVFGNVVVHTRRGVRRIDVHTIRAVRLDAHGGQSYPRKPCGRAFASTQLSLLHVGQRHTTDVPSRWSLDTLTSLLSIDTTVSQRMHSELWLGGAGGRFRIITAHSSQAAAPS